MQDLIQNYVSDLKKLREAFHDELAATAEELSKAMGVYARRSDAALASFMEKASARGLELEVSATARLSQFCGLPADGSPDRQSMTNRPGIPQQMRVCSELQPLQSRQSRMVRITTATAITSRSRRPDHTGFTGRGPLRPFTSSFRKNRSKLRS